mmetsp:Transcript_40390/g.75562  ORF Transcript_40390/g.75562 Transcript_40390/m.75562 type:complete len:213 (+) Transcript_40390:759-1397(+)
MTSSACMVWRHEQSFQPTLNAGLWSWTCRACPGICTRLPTSWLAAAAAGATSRRPCCTSRLTSSSCRCSSLAESRATEQPCSMFWAALTLSMRMPRPSWRPGATPCSLAFSSLARPFARGLRQRLGGCSLEPASFSECMYARACTTSKRPRCPSCPCPSSCSACRKPSPQRLPLLPRLPSFSWRRRRSWQRRLFAGSLVSGCAHVRASRRID